MRSTVDSIEEYYQIIVELVTIQDDGTEVWAGDKYVTNWSYNYCYYTHITFLRDPKTDQVWGLYEDGDEYAF